MHAAADGGRVRVPGAAGEIEVDVRLGTGEYWTMTGPAAGVMFHNKVALINFNTDL